jgi:hypothetical protein
MAPVVANIEPIDDALSVHIDWIDDSRSPAGRGVQRFRQANARVIQVERTDAGVMKRMERRVLD